MNNEEEINQLFKNIEAKSSVGEYIYRGEPKCYDKVSSSLFRQHQEAIEGGYFNINVVQKQNLIEARKFTHTKENLEIMAKLQHYGGETNFVDFTKDYRIALFFACNGYHKKDGKVILKNKVNTKEYELYEPRNPQNRIIAQKSIFIYPFKGFIIPGKGETILVSANLKESILDYLNKYHNISTTTIYNDLHGFIANKKIHQDAYTKFYLGITAYEKAKYEDDQNTRKKLLKNSIAHLSKAIHFNPNVHMFYVSRGVAYSEDEQNQKSIDDLNKALTFDPNFVESYNARGTAYAQDSQYSKAKADFDEVIKRDPQNFLAYFNRAFYSDKRFDPASEQDYIKAFILAKEQGETKVLQWIERALNEIKTRNPPPKKD